MIDKVKETLPQLATEAAKVVEGRITSQVAVLENIASLDHIKDIDGQWEEKSKILNDEVKRGGHTYLGVSDKSGNLTLNNGQRVNIKNEEYFQRALQEQRVVSDPIINQKDKTTIIMYAVPIKQNNKVVGVLVQARNNDLIDITKDITFGKSGKAFMINKKGVKVAHSKQELVTKMDNDFENVKSNPTLESLVELEKQMIDGKVGVGEYKYDGIIKYLGFSPVSGMNWSIAVAAPKDEVLAGLSSLEKTVSLWSVIFLILGTIMVLIISKTLSTGIITASNHLQLLAKGDFSKRIPEKNIQLKDEIGDMARSIETLQRSIKEMITNIKNNSMSIDSQSESLADVSKEMTSVSENVSSAIQEVARGTGSQAEDLLNITVALNQFGESINNIVTDIENIETNSTSVNNMASESNDDMKKLIDSVNKMSSSFEDFIEKISSLGNSIDKINEITMFINNIADQTNLLALNASIEAARAGDAGKGFAVVAEEIRKLAEQSKESSESINALINGITKETNVMINISDATNKELSGQVLAINTTIDSFKKIISAIDEVIPRIKAVNILASDISNEKNNILEKIESASSIAEEVYATSEEITASAEEMNNSTEEVATSAEILSITTKKMMEAVNKFKL